MLICGIFNVNGSEQRCAAPSMGYMLNQISDGLAVEAPQDFQSQVSRDLEARRLTRGKDPR